MKKKMIQMTLLVLVVMLAFTLVACGPKQEEGKVDQETATVNQETSNSYEVDSVKQSLIELLGIDESEVRVEDSDRGSIVSYGDWEVWFDCYILKDAKDAPEFFDIQTWDDIVYDKQLDEKDHKIWIEENDENSDDTVLYTVIAIKNNLVTSITSEVEPEALIASLNLN